MQPGHHPHRSVCVHVCRPHTHTRRQQEEMVTFLSSRSVRISLNSSTALMNLPILISFFFPFFFLPVIVCSGVGGGRRCPIIRASWAPQQLWGRKSALSSRRGITGNTGWESRTAFLKRESRPRGGGWGGDGGWAGQRALGRGRQTGNTPQRPEVKGDRR